jgi:hypothetical protein
MPGRWLPVHPDAPCVSQRKTGAGTSLGCGVLQKANAEALRGQPAWAGRVAMGSDLCCDPSGIMHAMRVTQVAQLGAELQAG